VAEGLSSKLDLEGDIDVHRICKRLNELKRNQELPFKPVLLLDNFEEIVEAFTVNDFNMLFELESCHVLFVIATIPMSLPSKASSSPFFGTMRKELLGAWSSEEFDHFLEESSRRSGVDLKDYRKDILDLAGRLPFLVQSACRRYAEAEPKELLLSSDELEEIHEQFADDVEPCFIEAWDSFDAKKKGVLLALLKGRNVGERYVLAEEELKELGYIFDGRLSSAFEEFVRDRMRGDAAQPRV
jgi:hypothetical protein